MNRWLLAVAASWGALFFLSAEKLTAQTEPAAAATPAAAAPNGEAAAPTLADRQDQLSQKYKQLEAVLLRMAELSDDPQRVALLRKAVAQSKEQLIGEQLTDIVELLQRERLANALTEQGEVKQDLTKLLELLLSEDRAKNVDEEKARLQQWIRDITNLINDQQGLQGETEGGGDCKGLGERQGQVGQKTDRLAKEIAEHEAKKQAEKNPSGEQPKPSDDKPEAKEPKPADEGKPNDGEPKEGEPKEGDPSDGQPSDGETSEGQPSDSQPSEGQPSESQPSQGQPSDGQPSQGQSQPSEQQPQNPTEQKLKSAQQRMEAAKKKLEEAERKAAIDEQTEAIRELRAAKAELEKILQQLREEEMQRMLAMLEQRFRKMLATQIDIYEATQRLDSVPVADRTRNDEIEAGRQSRREMELSDEARKALELLKQDGTAVAFPEAVQQLIEDMDQTAAWLGEAKVGELTQALEQDIIASLEEMLKALEKAQKDLEQKEQQGGQGQPSESGEPSLVDDLAELKLIRSLQIWVNRRTQLYRLKLEGQITPPETEELMEALRKLAGRQDRIYRTTRDIAEGKNQ